MSKNSNTIWLVLIGAVVLLVIIWVGRDLFLSRSSNVECEDGPRRTIDIRDFITQYSAYSVELEGAVSDKKLTAKLNPVQLQQLSESLQHANEFRKYLVAGYNACVVSKKQYTEYGATFQAMDSLSRQINTALSKPEVSAQEKTELGNLVKQYINLSQQLAPK
jgi:hypothetical protein